jgi:hypothetical protein
MVGGLACNSTINVGEHVKGSGTVVSEERAVSDFDQVSLTGAGELLIEQGEEEALTVEADDNLMQYITTKVKGNTLELGLEPNFNLIFSHQIVYHLTVKELSAVNISGSGHVVSGPLSSNMLSLSSAGSGKFEFPDLQTQSVSATTSGSGEFILAGQADQVTVNIGGSGKFNCPDLHAQSVDVVISGSGEVTTWVDETLNVRISGSGSVRYYGAPITDQTISGSGSIKQLGDK